ncbi:MAG TPA: hypothetical protein ENJ82_12155 [Bacteroidetes bacterium]|nr:hypothetical protein [Bacteroidota bacterium]
MTQARNYSNRKKYSFRILKHGEWKNLIFLIFPVLLGCEVPPSQANTSGIPKEFVKKTPRLPTLFVDTTGGTYSWTRFYNLVQGLQNRIKPPKGFKRKAVEKGSFAAWLRGIPLKPGKPPVMLYNGMQKGNQETHFAVIDMDVGKRDLQQCADAVMRLRAEYLYASQQVAAIHFNFTSGDVCAWSKWKQGFRPKIRGNKVTWSKTAQASNSYKTFRSYMNIVFNYAGTSSLEKEMERVPRVTSLKIGDVFIRGGFPGHAVLVMDVAEHPETGEKVFLLAQSYMPAQEMHILVNPMDSELSPWYAADFVGELNTPEWTFSQDELRRF